MAGYSQVPSKVLIWIQKTELHAIWLLKELGLGLRNRKMRLMTWSQVCPGTETLTGMSLIGVVIQNHFLVILCLSLLASTTVSFELHTETYISQ